MWRRARKAQCLRSKVQLSQMKKKLRWSTLKPSSESLWDAYICFNLLWSFYQDKKPTSTAMPVKAVTWLRIDFVLVLFVLSWVLTGACVDQWCHVGWSGALSFYLYVCGTEVSPICEVGVARKSSDTAGLPPQPWQLRTQVRWNFCAGSCSRSEEDAENFL